MTSFRSYQCVECRVDAVLARKGKLHNLCCSGRERVVPARRMWTYFRQQLAGTACTPTSLSATPSHMHSRAHQYDTRRPLWENEAIMHTHTGGQRYPVRQSRSRQPRGKHARAHTCTHTHLFEPAKRQPGGVKLLPPGLAAGTPALPSQSSRWAVSLPYGHQPILPRLWLRSLLLCLVRLVILSTEKPFESLPHRKAASPALLRRPELTER